MTAGMYLIRIWLREHRALAAFLAVLALSVKMTLPQGYMFAETSTKVISVQMCFDGLSHETVNLVIPMAGKTSTDDQRRQGKSADHCPFTALSFGSLVGADAPLLAIALAFILALGFAPIRRVPHEVSTYLRPPLRGPPATL